jgi:hypothetical protein
MPTYTYNCPEETGGCGHQYEVFILMSEYNPQLPPVCPGCKTRTHVRRNFKVDISSTSSHIQTQTLGSLAEKNTNSMSEDARLAQWRKDNAYKFDDPPNEPKMKLPRGAKRLLKPENLKPPKKLSRRKINDR